MLRDTERMQAHRVFNIHIVVFRFFAMCFRLFLEHVIDLWLKMDSSDNV